MISNIQFQEQLEQEIQKLTELEKRLRNRLATAPEGTLHILAAFCKITQLVFQRKHPGR